MLYQYHYIRQMRFEARTKKSFSYLHRQNPLPLQPRNGKQNKENANTLNNIGLNEKPLNLIGKIDNRAYKDMQKTKRVTVDELLKKNKLPQQLKQEYTHQIVEDYFDRLFSFMCDSSYRCRCQNILLYHEITSSLRSKMIDWMIQVLSSYKMSEETFFKSVYIMDSYLRKCKDKLQAKDLHLIGIASMFIAGKYQQIHPLKLQTFYDKIARKKFSKADILARQSLIVQAMGFQLQSSSVYDIARLAMQKIPFNMSQKSIKYLQKVNIYLSKMVLFSTQLAGLNFDLLSAGVIFIGLKTVQQIDPTVKPEDILPSICKLFCFSSEQLIEVSQKILDLAKNYSSYFPSLLNLKKFNRFQYQ